MKSILSIFILLFLTNIVHGAQEKHNESDVQKVQWYAETHFEKIVANGDKKFPLPIIEWTQLPDYIVFKDDYRYRSTGSTSPENDNEEPANNIFLTKSALKEMKKAQDCLENIHEQIIYSIAYMRVETEKEKHSSDIDNALYITEVKRRLERLKDIFSINGINIHKRQREVAVFERSMRAYLN